MLVTEFGISTDVKEEQPAKANSRILVTESGMSTDVKEEQRRKAYVPILVTEFGISDVKCELLGQANKVVDSSIGKVSQPASGGGLGRVSAPF